MKWLRVISPLLLGISGTTIALSYMGIFQSLELSVLDRWFRFRPAEAKEERVVVVTIAESDLNRLGQWPISDDILSSLISKINEQQPRAIGLDLYRDLPVQPGTNKLASILRSSPNLVGVEKIIGEAVQPSKFLKEQEQVAFADLIVDRDRVVRRGLLSVSLDNGRVQLGLATRLALMYLAQEGIELQPVDPIKRRLGRAVFLPLDKHYGGYVNADAGGFQILLNYRGIEESFYRVSIVDVLEGNIPPNLMRDRIVLIGSTAQSLNDLFATPYSSNPDRSEYLPGVFIHANLASQILSAALDGRKSIEVFSEPLEWLWIVVWTSIGTGITLLMLQRNNIGRDDFSVVKLNLVCIILPVTTILGSGYLLFLCGYWLPVIAPLVSSVGAVVAVSSYYQQDRQKLAFIDGLTQIPNRRFFDQFLEQQWLETKRKHLNLSLMLCDVDHFKKYNDTYGHQAGDLCLKKVADIISQSIGANNLAARYGGEEFAVVMPNTTPDEALKIAQDIGNNLRALQIPHNSSLTGKYVSLSCGIASTGKSMLASPDELIKQADGALYQAKEQGRDRAVIAS